jgi:NAD-dependent deacetylase
MTSARDEVLEAAERLRRARQVVVFTGAGVSAESGIATFRDAGGLWAEFPPQQFGNLPGLLRTALRRPRRFAEFLVAVLEPISAAEPNAAHRAIAAMERHTRVTVVTQNIDGLHQAAGSTIVHEVHGSLLTIVARKGRVLRQLSRQQMRQVVEALRRAGQKRLTLPRLLAAVRPLLGIGWHGTYRPNVVLFGEAMAEPAWSEALAAVRACDCLVIVGTSGEVFPAAQLPYQARNAAIINVDPAPALGDFRLPGPAATVLPALVEAAYGDLHV